MHLLATRNTLDTCIIIWSISKIFLNGFKRAVSCRTICRGQDCRYDFQPGKGRVCLNCNNKISKESKYEFLNIPVDQPYFVTLLAPKHVIMCGRP